MDSGARSGNGLLASLNADDFDAIRPYLWTVELLQGSTLLELGETFKHAYLPHSGVISLVLGLQTGERIEVAMFGRDGILGVMGALGMPFAAANAVVLLPGMASIIEVDRLREAAERSATLRAILLRHGQLLLMQAMQAAGCNASHVVEARLARWLLRVRDLAESNRFILTQELMAQMIGARRNSVSIVAHTLQQAKYIRYSRGHVEVLDLDGLTSVACGCYAAGKAQYERLRSSI
ncbi:MAG TPA: Crp/Fnr family transcriptional regulator [Steroidobacteraceae bacterium]|jgi:CRP-like cAMP-binding protein|nr:Crp/Fnr family transcriptional regulator [Steroidobacteraceae bacterium]